MTVDLDNLRALAEAVPGDGPWSRLIPGDAVPENGAYLGPTLTYIAALDPQTLLELLDLAALGAAWKRVEAALPEGWTVSSVADVGGHRRVPRLAEDQSWRAAAGNGGDGMYGFGPTPTAALTALAEKLEAREP